jgi:hypothetical protein
MSVKQDIIYWLVRLPFLGAPDLSSLVGRPEREVSWTLLELEKLGWIESVRPASPYLEDNALHAVSAAGVARLQEVNRRDLEGTFPVSRIDVIRRLASLEITDGINQFATALEDAVWRDRKLVLEELLSLPVATSPELRWWPPGVEAYGCIRHDGGSYAPFFIAWDRAAAPRFHRQRRVAGWYDFWDSTQLWGRDTIPSIIVLCWSQTEQDQWCDAVLASAD